VKLIVIGSGDISSSSIAATFPHPIYTDPTLSLFRKFGLTREHLRSKEGDAKKNRLSAVVWKVLKWSEIGEGIRSTSESDRDSLSEADLLGGEFVLSRGMQPTFTHQLSGDDVPRTPLSTLFRAAGYIPRHTSTPSLAGVRHDDREMTCIREDDRDALYDGEEEIASRLTSSGDGQDPVQGQVAATHPADDDEVREMKTASTRPAKLSRRRWSMPVGTGIGTGITTEGFATGRVATHREGGEESWAQVSAASRSSGSFGPYYPSKDFS